MTVVFIAIVANFAIGLILGGIIAIAIGINPMIVILAKPDVINVLPIAPLVMMTHVILLVYVVGVAHAMAANLDGMLVIGFSLAPIHEILMVLMTISSILNIGLIVGGIAAMTKGMNSLVALVADPGGIFGIGTASADL